MNLDTVKYELIFIKENSDNHEHRMMATEFLVAVEEQQYPILGVYGFIDDAMLEIEFNDLE